MIHSPLWGVTQWYLVITTNQHCVTSQKSKGLKMECIFWPLSLFWCACVYSFSLLVQSGSLKSCILCSGQCLVLLIIRKQLSFSLLGFLVYMCSMTNQDSLMFMVAAFTYILFGLPGHFQEMEKFISWDTTAVSNRIMTKMKSDSPLCSCRYPRDKVWAWFLMNA